MSLFIIMQFMKPGHCGFIYREDYIVMYKYRLTHTLHTPPWYPPWNRVTLPPLINTSQLPADWICSIFLISHTLNSPHIQKSVMLFSSTDDFKCVWKRHYIPAESCAKFTVVNSKQLFILAVGRGLNHQFYIPDKLVMGFIHINLNQQYMLCKILNKHIGRTF